MGLIRKLGYCPENGLDKQPCFYCGLKIATVGVYWNGHEAGYMYLHHGCAQKFLVRLARDIWQLESDSQSGRV